MFGPPIPMENGVKLPYGHGADTSRRHEKTRLVPVYASITAILWFKSQYQNLTKEGNLSALVRPSQNGLFSAASI